MKNVCLMSIVFVFILMMFSCSQHFTYMPPADAEIESGHFYCFIMSYIRLIRNNQSLLNQLQLRLILFRRVKASFLMMWMPEPGTCIQSPRVPI